MRLAPIALIVCVVLGSVAGVQASSLPAPAVTAPEAIVIDGWTGSVLYARSANVERYPASTVKIMTALLVLERRVPMHRLVVVSPVAATYGGSTAGLYAGEQITVWNLLHGMLLPSGNDAAIALAETVGGSVQHFVAMMNAEAGRLHLIHTHYLSPNGFDVPGEVSTAHDLAVVTRLAMQQPRFARLVRTRSWTVHGPSGQVLHHWTNLNKLLWSSSAVDGVKTGTTPGAGACLVASARMDGRWVIEVNMGSTESTRFSDGMALLNYGFGLASKLPSAH